jgi:hypothetical protein
MSQDMSLASMFTSLSIGLAGKEQGYLKLPSLPKDENHFVIWKLKVEAIVRGAGLMEVIEYEEALLHTKMVERFNVYRNERVLPTTNDEAEHKVVDHSITTLTQEQKDMLKNKSYKVYAALAETLTTADQMRILLNKTSIPDGDAYMLWKAIKERYDIRTTDATKERLWELFNGMKMDNNEDFKSYKAKVEEAVANLFSVEEKVPETRTKAKLITGLSTRYSAFVGALYTQDYSTMKLIDLCKKINDFEESTVFKTANADLSEYNPGLAAFANDQNKPKNQYRNKDNGGHNPSKDTSKDTNRCFTCNKAGHRAYDCYTNKDKKKCSNCKRVGHTDSECRYPKKNMNKNTDSKNEKKQNNDFGYFFAPVIPDNLYSGIINRNTWILDSGASKHLCTNKKLMKNLRTPTEKIQMKCANKQTVSLNEIGDATLRTINSDGESLIKLTEVAHAPTFQCNLISVGRLVEAGANVVFGEKDAKVITPQGKVVITAHKVGKLFIVPTSGKQVKNLERAFNATEITETKTDLWHCRLGHIGHQGLQDILQNKSVNGLNIDQAEHKLSKPKMCDSCLKGKQHRHPFGNEWKDKAENIMDKVHADLCGPVQPTRNGELYLSTVIDERSRMIFGELIKLKSDAADGIIAWIIKAKTFTGKPLKLFHSDGGGEYRGKKILKHFKDEGIEPRSTLPGTPQHNGIAERANRTLFESARSMLSHSKLPKEFWGDAVLNAIYIRNRCLTTSDKKKSPYELWTGNKPDIGHIRVFGCDAYMHIKDTDRTKLDFKSVKCILLGYSEYNNGYRLYNLSNRQIYYSRDIKCIENSFQHAQLLSEQLSNNTRKAGNPITEPATEEPKERNEDNKEITTMDNLGLIDGFSNSINTEKINAGIPKTVTFENKDSDINSEVDIELNHLDESDIKEDSSQEEKKEPTIDESNDSKRNEIATDPVPPKKVPRELRGILEAREHQYTSGPRSSKRAARAVDPGAIITDSNQLNEYSQSVIDNINEEDVIDYCFMMTTFHEPKSYKEAMKSKDAENWKEATNKEHDSLISNGTWKKCKLPPGREPIGCKWVYKVKIDKDGKVERYKARLVAKGYSQKEGIDYTETFAPVLKYKSLRILLSIAAIKDMEVKQMDVETAFLNAEIKEEVYMEQPEGFDDGKDTVCRLLKTLYGTKQASHEWNNTLNDFIVSLGFIRCKSDTCTYIKMSKNSNPIIIAVFVDDIIIMYSKIDEKEWLQYKKSFMEAFKMKDLNDAEWILGIRITRDRTARTIKLDHEVQINKSLETFNMNECNPASTPTEAKKLSYDDCPKAEEEKYEASKLPYKSIVGSLQYIALSTRPDIAYAVNQLSRFIANPGQSHWQAGKRVLRYLKGTAKSSLLYKDYDGNQNTKIEIFCDADWAGDTEDRKSTTGVIIKLNGCPIIWLSKKQSTVALSTAEAEYIAIATALQELLWINQYLTELNLKDNETATLKSDNQAAIRIATNDTLHSRSKHIDIRYHFIREVVKRGEVELNWISTKAQEADISTKGLDGNTFKGLRDRIMSR